MLGCDYEIFHLLRELLDVGLSPHAEVVFKEEV